MSLHQSEIVVDSFAGGGGASEGIEMALRGMSAHGPLLAPPDVTIAINHSGAAIAMHTTNHPNALHLEADIWTVDPLSVTAGRPVGLLWASPDCRHFSKAKGGAPVSNSVRGLAHVVGHWADQVRPRMIFLENVEEFQDWGPTIIGSKGYPVADPKKKGQDFRKWVSSFRKLGYKIEWRELRACDFGAPTIRKRLYIIMRRDGVPIRWPAATHGDPNSLDVREGRLPAWRTAAEIIDWALPCPSILMDCEGAQQYTSATGSRIIRPLADNTQARIAAGVKRWVLDAAKPFIVTCNHGGDGFRGQCLDVPFKTVTSSRDAHGLVQPLLVTYYGPRSDGTNDRSNTVLEPLRTITTEPRHSLVMAFLTAHHTNDRTGVPVDVPLRAITGIPKTDPVLVEAVLPPLTLTRCTAPARSPPSFAGMGHGMTGSS